MHQPRPSGQGDLGAPPTEQDRAAIERRVRQLTNLKNLSGVDSLRMGFALPDGGYALVQDMGGVLKTITSKPRALVEPEKPVAPDYSFVPMLFSGVVTDARPRGDAGVGLRLTEQCRRRLNGYKPQGLPPKELRLRKFRIDYHPKFVEFIPDIAGPLFTSQYAQLRPTWYSGAMAEVVQIVGGYGAQKQKVSKGDSPLEGADRMAIPPPILQVISEQARSRKLRQHGCLGMPDEKGQISFDYKFEMTDGVVFASDKRPWLVRVERNGIYAMPLPLIPATMTKRFRKYIEDVGDGEILAIIDRFGGMPSGEGFPPARDREYWERAGVVVKMGSADEFYGHLAYSSAMGWSFNKSGNAAFNTAHDYDDAGFGEGFAYRLDFEIGEIRKGGAVFEFNEEDGLSGALDRHMTDAVKPYLDALLKATASGARDAKVMAARYKFMSADLSTLYSRAATFSGNFDFQMDAEVDYWDQYEAPPIATASARLSLAGHGALHDPRSPQFQPSIKFPEPLMGGCISHDFLPELGAPMDKQPRSDTIMFGGFIGDDLYTVKFFRDGRGFKREVQSDFEPCMTVGSWTQVETYGDSSIEPPHFYTTDMDDRHERAPGVKTTKIEGRDLGYDTQPFFAFDEPFWMPGTLWRFRYIARTTKVHEVSGKSTEAGICIPYLNRNAVLYALRHNSGTVTTSEMLTRESVQDPHTYRFWTYDSVMHWAGGAAPPGVGNPYPKNGVPVWVESMNYSPGGCSDFADQGPWIPGLPADYTWLIHPEPNVWKLSGGGGAPPLATYYNIKMTEPEETGSVQMRILDASRLIHKDKPEAMYFLPSPSDIVGVFYKDATKIVFGDAIYANTSEHADNGQRHWWGHTDLADHRGAHHFIGVINE